MRSPAAAFDLRAALSEEIHGALAELDKPRVKPKGIHRCRVHLKRARALARVGRSCAPGLAAVFNESARSIMHSLSQARDFAALAASARATAKRSSRKSAIALRSAASAFDAARTSLAPLDLEPARAGMRDLLAMALVWPEASPRQIEKGGDHIAARARRARRRAQGSDLVLRRHQWRKREKDRLYAATLLGANWPDERKKRLKRGAALADVLGDERDVLLLIGCIEGNAALTGGDGPARRALRALERRASRLARRADRLGVALHAGGA